MRWATRRHCHIDRAACAWLIRRYIDEAPEFVFVDDPDDVPTMQHRSISAAQTSRTTTATAASRRFFGGTTSTIQSSGISRGSSTRPTSPTSATTPQRLSGSTPPSAASRWSSRMHASSSYGTALRRALRAAQASAHARPRTGLKDAKDPAGRSLWSTERAGFEPAKRLSTLTRFPVALLRPLGHLSGRGQGIRGARLALCGRHDVGRDVLDLLVAELTLERRHPVLAVRDPVDDEREVGLGVVEVGADVAGRSAAESV